MRGRIRIRNWRRLVLAAAVVGMFVLQTAGPAKRVKAADRYSLTVGISVNVTDWANHTSVARPVSGAVIRIDKVADLDVATGTYTETGAFRAGGVDYRNFDTEASIEAAPQYAEITKQTGVTGQTRTTGSSGQVTFGNVDPGMYLIQESDRTGDAKNYQTIDPYLLSVPEISMDSNGNVTVTAADVESYPKTAPETSGTTPGTPETPGTPTTPDMPETTTPTSLPKGNSPKTGEMEVDLMGILEAGLAAAAVLLIRKPGVRKLSSKDGDKPTSNDGNEFVSKDGSKLISNDSNRGEGREKHRIFLKERVRRQFWTEKNDENPVIAESRRFFCGSDSRWKRGQNDRTRADGRRIQDYGEVRGIIRNAEYKKREGRQVI